MLHTLGVNYTTQARLEPREAFSLFKSLGFGSAFAPYRDVVSREEEFADEAAKVGLVLETLHAPYGHINDIWLDGEAGDAMEAELIDTLRATSRCGAPIAVMHLSSGENAPCVSDIGRRRWDRIVEEAVRLGVTVAFENLRRLAHIAFAMELYRDVPNVGFCWDVGHEKSFAHGMEFMPLFGDRLVCTHIHDNHCQHNEDEHLLPFDGLIDYSVVAAHLKKSGYAGALSLEILPRKTDRYEGMSAEDYYARAFAAAERLRRLVDGE